MLIKGDVADPAFAPAAVEHTIQTLGGLDILVNNAAFQEHASDIEDLLSIEHFDRTLKTNLYGYFYMAKAALPHLKPGSAIINTGSETGIFGNASCWTTRPPRAASTPSPARWRRCWWARACG